MMYKILQLSYILPEILDMNKNWTQMKICSQNLLTHELKQENYLISDQSEFFRKRYQTEETVVIFGSLTLT